MKYRIVHQTRYTYSQPVILCHNLAHLQPRATDQQTCTSSFVAIEPAPAQIAEREDCFRNRVLYFAVQEPHTELVVTSTSEVELLAPLQIEDQQTWESVRELLRSGDDADHRLAAQFTLDSPLAASAPELAQYAGPSFGAGRPLLEAVHDLSSRIFHDFQFDPVGTSIVTPLSEVLARRGGVCQDFAHLAVACLRSFGLAARYVSGYLETVPPPGQPRLQGADASHAWFSVYVPGRGWADFDPTNDQRPGDRYVTTAWGRDYSDVTPLKGVVFGGGNTSLQVAVDMVRLYEGPPSNPQISQISW